MAKCRATPTDHCCWVGGKVCPYFDEVAVVKGKGCSLRTELGSWGAVKDDSRWKKLGFKPADVSREGGCGDFPLPGQTCFTCGVKG